MASSERGIALVSVLLLLTALLILAHIFAEKVWQSTRQTADTANRDQVFWAAHAGIEAARQRLSSEYTGSSGWLPFLADGLAGQYPPEPAWQININGLPVDVYLRDNLDDDDDVRRDNDLKLFILARARGRKGAEAMIECLCGFDLSGATVAFPQVAWRDSHPGTDLTGTPFITYGIAD